MMYRMYSIVTICRSEKYYLLFALNGFSTELERLAQDDPSIRLVSVEQLYQ